MALIVLVVIVLVYACVHRDWRAFVVALALALVCITVGPKRGGRPKRPENVRPISAGRTRPEDSVPEDDEDYTPMEMGDY